MAKTLYQKSLKPSLQKEAAELLEWLIAFLPGTVPASAEEAIIEFCDDVHALFDHRSELEKILETTPEALNKLQKEKLVKLDRDMKAAALLLFGASKGTLRRYREGRYDRSHWWWYLDELVRRKYLACNQPKAKVRYAVPAETSALLKVAEPRTAYKKEYSKKRR